MLEFLNQIDTRLFLFLNSLHSPFWDKVMWLISGKVEWIPLYLIILGFIIYKYRWKSFWLILAIVLMITLCDTVSSKIIKSSVERLRPTHTPELENLVHIVNGYKGGSYGFVSSHAANSIGLATFITMLFHKKWVSISIFIWAITVSYSRIYLGVHFPGDILGGALVGFIFARVIYIVLKKTAHLTNIQLEDVRYKS